jgi:hypothetical protein
MKIRKATRKQFLREVADASTQRAAEVSFELSHNETPTQYPLGDDGQDC